MNANADIAIWLAFGVTIGVSILLGGRFYRASLLVVGAMGGVVGSMSYLLLGYYFHRVVLAQLRAELPNRPAIPFHFSDALSARPDFLFALVALGVAAGLGARWVRLRRRTRTGAAPGSRIGGSTPPESSADRAREGPHERTVFVSYRREDAPDVVGRIYDRLVAYFGEDRVFKDVDSIPFGVDFRDHLDAMVKQADVMLVVVGPRWTGTSERPRLASPSDFVRIEIERALARDIPIVPILVRGATLPEEETLPPSVRPLVYRHGIEVRGDPDFHRDMDRLLARLGKG